MNTVTDILVDYIGGRSSFLATVASEIIRCLEECADRR